VKSTLLKSLQYLLLAAMAGLMVVFFFQTQIMDLDRHTAETQDILRLKQLDTLLEEEALKITSLQLSHYDNMVDLVVRINALTTRLKNPQGGVYGTIGPKMDGLIDNYSQLMKDKIDFIESIKSSMAIVRNTLNFIPTEIQRITSRSHNALEHQFHSMLATLLAQNINPSPQNLKKYNEAIADLKVLKSNPKTSLVSQANIKRILLHATTNMKANIDTITLFDSLSQLKTRDAIELIFVAHSDFAFERIKTADKYRLVLLTLSLLLFLGLGITLHNLNTARNAAQRTSQQFKDAVESINEGFAFFGNDGKLQFWNKTFEKLHENCGENLHTGISLGSFFSACSTSGTYVDYDTIDQNTAKMPNQSYTIKGINNTWMLASDSPMGDGGTACVRVDITDNKRAEAQMRNLSRAVEQSPASVIITDLDGVIEYVNPKFVEKTGYSAEEAIGQTPSIVKSGNRPAKDYKDLWTTIQAGNEWHGEFHNKRKDGSLFWEYASISPIKNETGETTHYLGIKEDITEQKETMAELLIAKEKAELANHAKTQFLANMSHELRTPLNAIIGFSEILKSQMFGPLGNSQYLDYSTDIHDSGNHLLGVINDILDISRIEIGTIEIREHPINLLALCLTCITMVQDHADHRKLTLKANISEQLPNIQGDAIRIKQIVLNLLTNAVKFTLAGGNVELKAFANDDQGITIQVIDTGIGIAPDQHDKIIEPFEQIGDIFSREHEGSGLGLYLVKSFITLHDGTFGIESELGKGSTFTFTLPAARVINTT